MIILSTYSSRVTLYFDDSDSKEALVSLFLSRLGRHKTEVVTNIVSDFLSSQFSDDRAISELGSSDVEQYLKFGTFKFSSVLPQYDYNDDIRKELADLRRIVDSLSANSITKGNNNVSVIPNEFKANLEDYSPTKPDNGINDTIEDDIPAEKNIDEDFDMEAPDMDLSLLNGFI